ncbi:hypothetical protein Pla123a_05200 [Posidoniimonas polymericola]|uniref:HEAT repeat protein n=1 Tax=Posidoniimonas polymericola TaxID=2528002 RepID=A0A5C5ZGN0_9BACT|nr:hypothetical protein [Posidoniimonas polymericola]TWT85713.1 hypothetical protein Pla123a_05200 [Posidoniimonas polymericola]
MTHDQILAALAGGGNDRLAAADRAMIDGEGAGPIAATLAAHAGDSDIGEPCIAALEKCGPPTVDQLDALVNLLNADELPAYWAATLIGRLGPAGAPAAAQLAETAAAQRPIAVRERAVWAISKIGPPASGCREALEPLTESPQPRLARLAKQALAAVET